MSRVIQAFQHQSQEGPEPRRLELSINQEDGSLLTAPLLSVVMASTDALYQDLHDMAHGEIDIASAQREEDKPPDEATKTKEKMANLSFSQRRHELAWRLASHGKALSHVAALTTAAATTQLGSATQVSSRALQHARTAWVQADEAQDALYFFHAQLFPARAAPHDVYAALDTLLAKSFFDLPQDMRLTTDRYQSSNEQAWSSTQLADRWHMAVREKLLQGEVAWMRQHGVSVPWRISLRGGIVRLTHGIPKHTLSNGNSNSSNSNNNSNSSNSNNNNNNNNNNATDNGNNSNNSNTPLYPIEAILTVLSTDPNPSWTLLAVECHAQAKTGQSNHQLDTINRQRLDLHRLCALAMNKQEKTYMDQTTTGTTTSATTTATTTATAPTTTTTTTNNSTSSAPTASSTPSTPPSIPRPLHALFQVAHIFSLSWQLELLSAQAQALRKGMWGGTSAGITVTPVQFFDNRSILGVVSISFWTVDDRYGPPLMGDLQPEQENAPSSSDSVSTVARSIHTPSITNQFTLAVRAEPDFGMKVALSGGMDVGQDITSSGSATSTTSTSNQTTPLHVRATIRRLLEATSNPFALSASEALLAATQLCAERKCHAIVQALPAVLPPWISVRVERGSLAVAAHIQYAYSAGTHSKLNAAATSSPSPLLSDHVVLFRLGCDARTGSFTPTFARETDLLQALACNDLSTTATDSVTSLRMAQYQNLRAAAGRRGGGAAAALTGRVVRDAMDGLVRSMNVLGQRTGVGGGWKDNDDQSPRLRQRAIQLACKDVGVSLMSCCGMAAVYGLSAVALRVATGVSAHADRAGGNVPVLDGVTLLPTPPLALLIDQSLVQTVSRSSEGERIQQSRTEQELLGIGCRVDEVEGLTLYPLHLRVQLETPTSIPERVECRLGRWEPLPAQPVLIQADDPDEPALKKRGTIPSGKDGSAGSVAGSSRSWMTEVEFMAGLVAQQLDL
eukprot:Nitzschia sp. Nitz4//scaffold89_size161592//34285//37170//NITZ4_002366-RA/size161592-processed-gene-0.5-mRNA-1//1//CDS//3329559580//4217//frame0